MNYQTRSETTGLGYFNTIKDALDAAEKDETIWKISFESASGERIRLIVDKDAHGDFWILDLI